MDYEKMSAQELAAELEKAQNKKFYLDMSDYWTTSDFALARKLDATIIYLEKLIEAKNEK